MLILKHVEHRGINTQDPTRDLLLGRTGSWLAIFSHATLHVLLRTSYFIMVSKYYYNIKISFVNTY